jgi:S1-C subfamily serine protease
MRRLLLLVFLLFVSFDGLTYGRSETALYQQVLSDHVVELETDDGYCTAVMIQPDRFLTANHCLSVGEMVFIDQFHAHYPVLDVVKADADLDLALLHSHVATKKPIVLGASLPDATPVMGIGYSSVFNAIQAPGYVTGAVLTTYRGLLVVVTHAYRPGYSGGPLVNFDERLVGINVMTDERHNIGLSVSLSVIRFFLEEK